MTLLPTRWEIFRNGEPLGTLMMKWKTDAVKSYQDLGEAPLVERIDGTSIGHVREDLAEALANLRALNIMAESQWWEAGGSRERGPL